jgi:pullulanase/glycogen debranching enzyme
MKFQFGLAQALSLCVLSASSLLAGCGSGSSAPTSSTPTTPATPSIAAATVRVHFYRVQKDEAKWGVYSWEGPKTPSATWIVDRFLFAKADSFGGYVDIPVDTAKAAMKFLVTDGDGNKNCGSDQSITLASNIASVGQEVWMAEGSCTVSDKVLPITLANFGNASALWLNKSTIAWPGVPTTGSYKMYYAANGGIAVDANGNFTGADGSYSLSAATPLATELQSKFPHVKGATALKLLDADAANAPARLSGQVVVAQLGADGKLVQATSLQIAGAIDDVYAANAQGKTLGLSFDSNNVASFRIWAPTAKSVKLNLYADATGAAKTTVDMNLDAASGVWSYNANSASYTNSAYYTYSVNVFSRYADNKVVSNEITDPYSLSLSSNSTRSFVANLASPELKPDGWDGHTIPALASPADISLYELHIRDFSASDATVSSANRGKYLAFTETAANGMKHLKRLQQAGLTHIHLLPTFDLASIPESGCVTPAIPAAALDSDQQQAAVAAVADTDCFNWGYDPYHYSAPEGSYASNAADGKVRIKEFRAMVKSLHDNGLRVAMDVVYNHTKDAKQNDKSVLDKIVPGYYYRLNPSGDITTDSCCNDTAAENTMMAKLMIDSVSIWASQYQVDSFRFDLMGFHSLPTMNKLKADVSTAAGRPIYIYGEAWNFGTVQNDARFVQARQANMAGSGIGSFNDRLRDAVRGGGCCDDGTNTISQQGFINGVFYDKNATSSQSQDDLLRLADLVRVGLAGTLKDYSFVDRTGTLKKSSAIDYAGMSAGYSADPFETINYVEAHDNQTLFDINAYKLPQNTPIAERLRVQNLGTAIMTLAQGVPFYHAGQEILRSKSLDRDSYNSGDWFNLLDYSYQSNNFGVGLPAANRNKDNWPLMRPILTNNLIKPNSAQIVATRDYATEMMAIRKDSSLFRLRSGQEVQNRLSFYNTGSSQVAGVVAMQINGSSPSVLADAKYKSVVVLFNVDKVAKSVTIDALKGKNLSVHPVQQNSSADSIAKTATYASASGAFSIPARTTVVFIEQ